MVTLVTATDIVEVVTFLSCSYSSVKIKGNQLVSLGSLVEIFLSHFMILCSSLLAQDSTAVRGILARQVPSAIGLLAIIPMLAHDPRLVIDTCSIEFVHDLTHVTVYLLADTNSNFLTPGNELFNITVFFP